MVIGSGRLKEPRIIISGHDSWCKELSSSPSEQTEKKKNGERIKDRHWREEYWHLKKKKWCQPESALWNKQWRYQKASITSPYIALQHTCKGLLNVK